MIGRSNLSKGGGSADVVNGIIEQYLAENETIDANTFVEFVNHFQDNTIDNTIVLYDIASTLIDTNKVFIAYAESSNQYLYGIVCNISNDTITYGVRTTIFNNSYFGQGLSVVFVSTNKVFIAHRWGYNLAGIVCTISGTTITVGTDVALTTGSGDKYSNATAILIDTNKVFIAHRGSSSGATYGIVCTISGTTITAGTDKLIWANSYLYTSAIKISTNKVFLSYSGASSTDKFLHGIVCTISGTTITVGTDTTLVATDYSYDNNEPILIDTDKIIIFHHVGYSNPTLNGIICTINGSSINTGSDIILLQTAPSVQDTLLIENNKVMLATTQNSVLNGMICTINDATLEISNAISLSSNDGSYYYANLILLGTNKVFIAHSNNSTNKYLNGMIVYVSGMDILTDTDHRTIKPSVNKIDGLTKTSGTSSSPADVWVLDNE